MNKLILIVALLLLPSSALALELGEAKAQGLLGETPSGYLEPVSKKPSGEVMALMNDINKRRRAKYRQIAKKNGTELTAVEALAGKKAIEKTPSGEYIKSGSEWMKK